MNSVRHRVFISYHHDDQHEVKSFIDTFDDERRVFITRGLGIGMEQDIIDSTDTDYVMRQIRKLYLKDSTVTILLIGKCTWARRYVDWEIQASLRHGGTVTPNGLLGIKLPSYKKSGYTARLNLNLKQPDTQADCYARVIDYPSRRDTLANTIDDAFDARFSKAHLIANPRKRFLHNRQCP
ncbi:TIR domain-containing protein [Chloroflexota bacterium]